MAASPCAAPNGNMSLAAPRLTIRAWQLLLVLVVALPGSAFWGWHLHSEAKEAEAIAYREVRLVADNVAARIEQVLKDQEQLLHLFASEFSGDPPVRSAAFAPAQFARIHPQMQNLGVRDLQANNIYSFRANPTPPAEALGFPWVATGIRSDAFAVGDAFLGRLSGRWVSVLTHPVHDAAGKRTGFVNFSLDLLNLGQRVLDSVPRHALTTVLDAELRVLMRSTDAESWTGRDLPPELARMYRDSREGYVRSADAGGTVRLWAYVSVPRTGWRVTVGVPEDVALQGYRALRNRGLLIGVSALAMLLAAAWLVAGMIARPIRALATLSAEVSRGNETARAAVAGPAEVAEVATQINRMLDRIARHREEREALGRHYDTLLRNARDIVLLFDDQGRIVEANDAALQAYGRSAEEMQALTLADLRAPESLAAVGADWQASSNPDGTLFEAVHRRKDGSTFPVEVSARSIEIEGKLYRQSFVRDITQRKEGELALQGQLEELRRWHEAMLGREMRVLELKREVNALLARAGQPPRYAEGADGVAADAGTGP